MRSSSLDQLAARFSAARSRIPGSLRARSPAAALLTVLALSLAVPEGGRAAPPGLPPNPTVQAMLDSVSADTLGASISRLQGFFTRHTSSDTLSQTTGIGAARRWIRSRFDAFAAHPGASLVPSYFSFDTTVCGAYGRHANVVATLPGALAPDRHFIVTGHMDSRTRILCNATAFAPGADDDGSGTALVIEMARVLSRFDLESTLILMTVTGEEQGLFGSAAYARWAFAHGERIDGMVTNDIVGAITGCVNPACPEGEPVLTDSMSVRHFSRDPSTSVHRQLTRALKLAVARYLPEFTVKLIPARDRPGRSGDHFPFDNLGYPAARFTEPYEFGDGTGNNGAQHNEFDLIERVNFPFLARVTKVNIAGFANLALAPERPQTPLVLAEPNGTLRLIWPSVLTAPDVAGYRVALRGTEPDSLFYFDIRDAGLDPGNQQDYTLTGLAPDVSVYVSVSAYDTDYNESVFSNEVLATPHVTAVGDEEAAGGLLLEPIQPNPTTGAARVHFTLPARGLVTIEVLDIQGRRVALLAERAFEPGPHAVEWDGRDGSGHEVVTGAYLVRMEVQGYPAAAARKLIRVR